MFSEKEEEGLEGGLWKVSLAAGWSRGRARGKNLPLFFAAGFGGPLGSPALVLRKKEREGGRKCRVVYYYSRPCRSIPLYPWVEKAATAEAALLLTTF